MKNLFVESLWNQVPEFSQSPASLHPSLPMPSDHPPRLSSSPCCIYEKSSLPNQTTGPRHPGNKSPQVFNVSMQDATTACTGLPPPLPSDLPWCSHRLAAGARGMRCGRKTVVLQRSKLPFTHTQSDKNADDGSLELQRSTPQEKLFSQRMSKITVPEATSNPITLEVTYYLLLI